MKWEVLIGEEWVATYNTKEGAEAAAAILRDRGTSGVKIQPAGALSDSDPVEVTALPLSMRKQ